MHVSSLPGEYSIGNFGKAAFEFIDFLKSCGFKYWQVLPFSMVDDCNSPYKSCSAFGVNQFFIDPETLKEKGLLFLRMMQWGIGLFIGGMAGLAALISTDFTKYFTIFHLIFFDNDDWLLNPKTDLLINIVPEGFFRDTA